MVPMRVFYGAGGISGKLFCVADLVCWLGF